MSGQPRRGGTQGGIRECERRRETATRRSGDTGAAVSVASRPASAARSERSERRREGYPPEGSRPRSGLGRVARSRSDAPGFILWRVAPVSIICTVLVSDNVNVYVSVSIGIGIGIGIEETSK